MRLRSSVWLRLILLGFLLLPAAVPASAAPPPALADTWIAFTSLAQGEEGIWLVHPDGASLHRLTQGRDTYANWSPDGTKLAYVHEITSTLARGGDPISYTSEIRIVNTSGDVLYTVGPSDWATGERAAPAQGSTGAPQWSPDGRALTFGVDLRHSYVLGWAGRRTFYLDPPRLEVGSGPDTSFYPNGLLMLDQTWGPGPVPTWVRAGLELGSCQLLAYDQTVLGTNSAIYFNPRWSPSGQHLTVYQQASGGTSFSNALLQVSAAGQVERTLFESAGLVLYNAAEWSPDGQQHLVGVSTDLTVWFWEVALGMAGPTGGPKNIALLPQTPPPEGYLYVLDQAGGKVPVVAPQQGAIDLISRQPWSPDGTQVVFMRANHPAVANVPAEGLGIYAGPPGQASRIVPFVPLGPGLDLSQAYPAWQPVPLGPLPTMVPLGPYSPAATMMPTVGPTVPPSAATATATAKPTPAHTLLPLPTFTPQPTAIPPAPPPPQSIMPALILIGEILLALLLVGLIVWVYMRSKRPTDGAPPGLNLPFLRRRPAGSGPSRETGLLRGRSRKETPAGAAPRRGLGLLKRPPRKEAVAEPAAPPEAAVLPEPAVAATSEDASAAPPTSRAEPAPSPEPGARAREAAPPSPEPAPTPTEPEATIPSLRTRRTEGAAWPGVSTRPTAAPEEAPPPSALPEEMPAAPLPHVLPEEMPAAPPPGPGPEAPTPPTVQELLQEGIAQVQAGNAPAGFALLRQVVDESPDDADAWLWLGWAAASQNQRDLAEKCFLRAQQLGAQQATQALEWLRKR